MDLRSWCELNLDDGQDKGDEFAARCPWCQELGKFSVNIEKQLFRCFRDRCASQGWAGKLVAYVDDITLREAREKLRRDDDAPTLPSHERKAKSRELLAIELPAEFIACHEPDRIVDGKPKPWRMPKALQDRDIKPEVLSQYGVGFCREGPQYNRCVLPVRCAGVSAWTARDLTDEHESNPRRPKYNNPAGKWVDSVFFGWDDADRSGADLVLVEGPFDVLKIASHGINAIGLMGKELKPSQPRRKLLFDLPPGTAIIIMMDPSVSALDIDGLVAMIPRRHKVYLANLLDGVTQENMTHEQKIKGVDPGNSTREQAMMAIDLARLAR